jgi:hypothetical protein
MIRLDLKAVAEHARRAGDEELLDRVTVFRVETEKAALSLYEDELSRRGFDDARIDAHEVERFSKIVLTADGRPIQCNFCARPAVVQARGWHKLWGRIPIFPRWFSRCEVHSE